MASEMSPELRQACADVAAVQEEAAAAHVEGGREDLPLPQASALPVAAEATGRARLDTDGDADMSPAPRQRSRSPRRGSAAVGQQRPAAADVDFRLRFTQILAAKSFFNNISMLEEACLAVCYSPGPGGFSGLMADAVDSTRVALVQGRLGAIVDLNVPQEQASFCVKVKSVLDCLATAHAQHFLDIYRKAGSTDITIRVHEPGSGRAHSKYEVRTLARQSETIPLDEMIMSYYVEIELEAFRTALKMAKTKKACGIQFRLYEAPATGEATQCMWFVLAYEGEDTRGTHPFLSRVVVSETGVDGEPVIVRAASAEEDCADGEGSEEEDLAQYKLLYSGEFAVDYLNNFVRSMEKVNVTLRLKNGNPLILDYPLGSVTTDSLRYVLAARM